MKSRNVKSAREHLLDKYNLSLAQKSITDINALKCEAKTLNEQSSNSCLNPFLRQSSKMGKKKSLCFSKGMNQDKITNQYIKSSSQYMNHNINHSNKEISKSKKYCNLKENCGSNSETNNDSIQNINNMPQSGLKDIGMKNIVLQNVVQNNDKHTEDKISRNIIMEMMIPTTLNFDSIDYKDTTLTPSNDIPSTSLILSENASNNKISYQMSTLNTETRNFENTSTYEQVHFMLPPKTHISSLKLLNYKNAGNEEASKTHIVIRKNNEKLVQYDVDHNAPNKNIFEMTTTMIRNKSSEDEEYILEAWDHNTIDPTTFIIDNVSYTIELKYEY